MSIEQIGKGFEGNKDQMKDNIMKILRIFITMIVSNCDIFHIINFFALIDPYVLKIEF